MKTNDVMTRDVHTCLPETDLGLVAMQMWEGDFGVLPVVADGGEVVGMITDRDICMAAASRNKAPREIRADEVMTGEVYSCAADDEIHAALKVMEERRVRRLPVLEHGKIVGLLSLNDLALKARSSKLADLTAQEVEETLKAICSHPTYALGRPFKNVARKLETATA
jgi:CBS domain-containing protein